VWLQQAKSAVEALPITANQDNAKPVRLSLSAKTISHPAIFFSYNKSANS
jgi:hypothetical protein